MATVAPYGAWASPISAAHVAEGEISFAEVQASAGAVTWVERRPAEEGRSAVVRWTPDGRIEDLLPAGYNARNRVHEYGGGVYLAAGPTLFFTNFADQRLYRLDGDGGEPRPITPEPATPAGLRYADLRGLPGGRLVCVRERHEPAGVTNELVALPADGSAPPVVLAGGHDFYASPRPSPDGRFLAWTSWDHPNMPWDGTELWVAELTPDGRLGEPALVAGGPEESIFQPEWSPDGRLHFVSDRSGWWNLYRREPGGEIRPLAPMAAEFGAPAWQFDYATYAFLEDGRIACAYGVGGTQRLALLDPGSGELDDLALPFDVFQPPSLRAAGGRLACIAASPTRPQSVVVVDLATGGHEVLRTSIGREPEPGDISVPRAIEFPTTGGDTAYALYYPPANRDFAAPAGERPPLIVASHGGPTGNTSPELDTYVQFFTSRGIGLVDVNYRGSTGYGRAYRTKLYGRWGEADTDDCIAAARYLVERGEVDGDRLAIRGGSAGGYTTLCALAFHEVFAAGASYFGLADLETFVHDTHKFESRYLDRLVGPYPERADLYRERSPIHAADRLSCPVILLQGLEDAIVPPSQAEVMVKALRAKGIPYAYLAFEGEQHGFRKAANIRRALEAELAFYGKVLGFEPADDLPPLELQ